MTETPSAVGALRRALRRRWWVLAVCAVVTPVIAYALSASQHKQYQSTADVLFRNPGLDQTFFGTPTFQASTDPARAAATNTQLLSLGAVADRTVLALSGKLRSSTLDPTLMGVTPAYVSSHVSVTNDGQSDISHVMATQPTSRRAAHLANTFALQFIALRQQADQAKIAQARALVQRQLSRLGPGRRAGATGKLLQGRAEDLALLTALQTGNAEIVQYAQPPTSPASPKPAQNAVVGLGGGLLLGLVLVFLLARADRRLEDADEATASIGYPMVGLIPRSRSLDATKSDVRQLSHHDADAFQMLRTTLRYFNVDKTVSSVLVTSPGSGDGKSTVSWNLAAAAGAAGVRVLLIEADLRNPSLQERQQIKASAGLAQVLAGEFDLDDVVHHVPVGVSQNGTDPQWPLTSNSHSDNGFDVVVAGGVPPNPTQMMESRRADEVFEYAKRTYDLVIIDAPPTTIVADAVPLLRKVAGVLIVARLGRTTWEQGARLRQQLEQVQAPVLGVVVNCASPDEAGYGYGYKYGYGAPRSQTPA